MPERWATPAELERLLKLVRRLQWGQGAMCPVCSGGGKEGHKEDCEVLRTLQDHEEKKRWGSV